MLDSLGWTPTLEDQFAPYDADGLEPARVAVEHRGGISSTPLGESGPAEVAGRLRDAVLPGGGLFLDTPGMRELRLWESEDGLVQTFDGVAAAAALCRFADGTLALERYETWKKLQAELGHLAVEQDARLRSEARKEIRRRVRSRRKVSW